MSIAHPAPFVRLLLACALSGLAALAGLAAQAQEPLRLTITDGVIEPIPLAFPTFEAETAEAAEFAQRVTDLVRADLENSGLFRAVDPAAFLSQHARFDQQVAFGDWRAIGAQGLVTGAVAVQGGAMTVKFRLHDIVQGEELGAGQQLAGTTEGWRRMAHKVADQVYARITGEQGYFDSRVVFVAETGPKDDRRKRIAVMDHDGANVSYLTGSADIVLAPRFSPTGDRVLYTSWETGFPAIRVIDVASVTPRAVQTQQGDMAFSPRFSRDGGAVIYSVAQGGNTDIWRTELGSGIHTRLTQAPSIETAPSLSPDGTRIVFESDRSGTQQLYVMPASGGEARRISFGEGRYASPVWSPRGDRIAFVKQNAGRFHIGVMRTDGSQERLLTASFLDESPTWSPNGRVIMFTRETQGEQGAPSLYSVDISGRNLRRVATPDGASDPSWGPLQP
ncbi:MAG: Tol-Pal system beta propeller repeat protein TolB [Paracoccaceae bacterium]